MKYDKQQLRTLFQNQFNIVEWTNVLINLFGTTQLRTTPESIDVDQEQGRGYYLGEMTTADNYKIGLFHYEITRGSVAHKRVGLRNLVKTFINPSFGEFDTALVVFSDNDHWRLSYISDIRGEKTAPKRFTFVFGDSKFQYNTAVNRFSNLQSKGITQTNVFDAFSVEVLTKEFYNDLFNWYTWTIDSQMGVTFPNNTQIQDDDRELIDTKIIRLITRIMFVWFIKQKGLIPDIIFDEHELKKILRHFDPQSTHSGNYYNAILQNLFFATLNRAIIDEDNLQRGFAKGEGKDLKTLYRYSEMFSIPEEEVINLFAEVPFLNGGLFECLDKTKTIDGVEKSYNLDGFSRNDSKFGNGKFRNRAFVPNQLFFDPEKGLFAILKRYNFTIEENSTNEQTVALDPELLGKVFENLLGVYNPETQESARKSSGSFYTPREIVNYMIDESLIAYLGDTDFTRSLFAENFSMDELFWSDYQAVAGKLKSIKVLDPACGSGAFPMGLLNRVIEILKRIGTDESDYQLKLNLIENCIYGVDIQPIATQISKLRFFISLICDCNPDNTKPNFGIPTLPNLETKFVCANTLIGKKKLQIGDFCGTLFEDPRIVEIKKELQTTRHQHFKARTANEKILLRKQDEKQRQKLALLLQENEQFAPEDALQLAAWNPYDQNSTSPFFDAEWMFGVSGGFDVVIGNPPYISTKGVTLEDKQKYEVEFGFSDDTYNLFTFKAISLLAANGSLTYITPKTFWTTQTKRNMRDLILSKTIRYIFDTANPFESAMVDTCITQVVNKPYNANNEILFLDGSKDLKNPTILPLVKQSVYLNTQNLVIFKPTTQNMKIWNLYGEKVKDLYNKWWDKIETSKKITQNAVELQKYRESLKPGDVALLGCLTEGGQGLATANNGRYIAVRKSTKWANNILESRPKKLTEAIQKYKIKSSELDDLTPQEFLATKSEIEIAEKFDTLKEKYGRDIFGQGYIYRLIDDNEMADVDSLTDDEKENGIATTKNYYVPYDKGDKDGNRWYLETPFAIAWSRENVRFLKTNSGKKGEGMPVVRNPQFNFKEGFCWNLINGTRSENDLKFRMCSIGVNDVGGMSLHSMINLVPDYYIVCLCNSNLMSRYTESYVNFTVNFQINDARLLPMVIPTKQQQSQFKSIFESAIAIKQQQFSSTVSAEIAEEKLSEIQKLLDDLVAELYGI